MKCLLGLALGIAVILVQPVLASSVLAAEYLGRNIDGRKYAAQAYSYETGGAFDVQVRFKEHWATLYFAGGSQQTIRLHNPVITNPSSIHGWGAPFSFSVGGLLRIGLGASDLGNRELPRPRPFDGLWRVRLRAEDLR